jgi:O-antigen/teichoic acid export membrane protein
LEPLASQHIARNALWLNLREAIGIFCSFGTSVILARFLGIEGLGLVTCYSATLLTLQNLAELGTPRAIMILTAKSVGESTQANAFSRLFRASLTINSTLWGFLVLIFMGARFFGGAHLLPSYITDDILLPLFGSVLFLFLYSNSCGVFNGLRRMEYAFALGTIFNISYLLIVSVPVILGGTASGVLWSWLAVTALTGLLSIFIFHRFLGENAISHKAKSPLHLKRVLKLGLQLWLQAPFFYQYGVLMAISYHRPASEVGLMQISFALINLTELLLGSLEVAFTASVAAAQSGPSWTKRVGELHPALLRLSATLRLFFLFLWVILGRYLLGLIYGAPFEEAYPILVTLALVLFLESARYVTDPVLNTSGFTHVVMVAEGIKISLAALLALLVSAHYSIFFVALSLFLASCPAILLKVFYTGRVLGRKIWGLFGQVTLLWIALVLTYWMNLGFLSLLFWLMALILWVYLFRHELLGIVNLLRTAIWGLIRDFPLLKKDR